MKKTNIYIFNPYYGLRNDRKRIVLTNTPFFKMPIGIAEEDIITFIHPVFAIIFTFFDGKRTLDNAINKISNLLNSSYEEVFNFITPFINNNKRITLKYENKVFEFPINILLNNTNGKYKERNLDFNEYLISEDYDFDTYRLYEGPTSINLLINTICATDCVYCYVDRRIQDNCKIPIERLKELVREAKKMKVVNFDIAGTEIFLYKHWDELIEEMIINGFYPYLSTKVPINENKVKRLKEIGVNDLQLSIDSINDKEISTVTKANTSNYIEKILTTLSFLEKYEINCAINVVLTKENSTQEGILALINKMEEYSNIERITFNPAERSVYWNSDDYDKRKNTIKELENIREMLMKIKDDYVFDIVFAGFSKKDEFINEHKVLLDAHNNRSLCSANKEQICILNDGQVTICEELYWNSKFIIGNVLHQSIKEIWESDKALKLENLTREDFSSKSVCQTCPSFDNCRLDIGVCWSNVASAYGKNNWDFPSPSCPYAPPLMFSMYHE